MALGTAAPGGVPMTVPPPAEVLARTPYWTFHRFGIERRRADVIVRAAMSARRLEETVGMDPVSARQRLEAFPGVGPWTSAKVASVALGDADAVPVGDYHLPHMVGYAFDGTPRSTDERMLELLEPYRPHRARVIRLLLLEGASAPRFGPRMPLRDIKGS
jgi:3-methyladenine DNA glycosylase/8-oxoguanine DNA glycosylase